MNADKIMNLSTLAFTVPMMLRSMEMRRNPYLRTAGYGAAAVLLLYTLNELHDQEK